jgi:hypothetical protein
MRDTECFSMNTDISTGSAGPRVKKAPAKDLTRSVLPTRWAPRR